MESAAITILFLLLGLVLYFLPTILCRDYRFRSEAFFWNLVIGWTIIGWFIVFIFFSTMTPHKKKMTNRMILHH
jgi:hypothetical protein